MTTADADARVLAAYRAGMAHAEELCRITAEKITGIPNWAHNCAVFIGLTSAEMDDAAIRARVTEGK